MSVPNIPTHVSITPVGSRVTCSPPPVGTDRDWLVLVASDAISEFEKRMLEQGWTLDGSFIPPEHDTAPPDERFYSYKLGEENVIVTPSAIFHRRFLAASSVAQRLNLLDKQDRIALFQAVLYGRGVITPPAVTSTFLDKVFE